MKKELITVGICTASIATVVTALMILSFAPTLNFHGSIGVDFETTSIHARIKMWKNDVLVFNEYHAGLVTNLGDNMTLFKLFGDTDLQVNDIPFTDNATFISIGNQGSLSVASVVLPAEWNRTAGTIEDEGQSTLNITCTFEPSGSFTADCIGLNFNATASANNLWAYDTFTEVTGDDTYTINVEFQVSVSHS